MVALADPDCHANADCHLFEHGDTKPYLDPTTHPKPHLDGEPDVDAHACSYGVANGKSFVHRVAHKCASGNTHRHGGSDFLAHRESDAKQDEQRNRFPHTLRLGKPNCIPNSYLHAASHGHAIGNRVVHGFSECYLAAGVSHSG
ncbi:MAG: hypothetical protein NZL88_11405, partial [Gaiellaceae bacterium]|nr:hypothetical protein [Gaiellaceae bacterium]